MSWEELHLKNNTIISSTQGNFSDGEGPVYTENKYDLNSFPSDGDRATQECDLSTDDGFVADRSIPGTLHTWGTPIFVPTTATKKQSDKLALPSLTYDSYDCTIPEYAEPADWISSERAYKLPIPEQESAHRSAIAKMEDRKITTNRIALKMQNIDVVKAERMRCCCTTYVVREYENKRLRHGGSNYCSNRFCAICAHRRSMRILSKYQPILKDFGADKWRYHLVLTYKNEKKPIKRSVISKHIRNFTRRKFWERYTLAGGLYAIETTYNGKDATFHTHVHMLIYTMRPIATIQYGKEENRGKFQNAVNQEVSDMWMKTTKNSFIVQGGKLKGTLFEMVKYISKMHSHKDGSIGIEDLPAQKFRDLYEWTTGSRFISAFGGLYGKLSKKELDDLEGDVTGMEEELEIETDFGDEAYVEYVYTFKENLNRYVITAERKYDPIVSRDSFVFVQRE